MEFRVIAYLRHLLDGEGPADAEEVRKSVGEETFDEAVRSIAGYLRQCADGDHPPPVVLPAGVLPGLPDLTPIFEITDYGDGKMVQLLDSLAPSVRESVLRLAQTFLAPKVPTKPTYFPYLATPFDRTLLVTDPEEGARQLMRWLEELDKKMPE